MYINLRLTYFTYLLNGDRQWLRLRYHWT